jgi:molybdate transport system substrate-binding protein
MAMVAKGKVEIGFIFMSEMDEPGIDVVGPLPQQVSPRNKFAGFVSAHAKNPAAAKALLHFLSSPEAAPVYQAHAMEPSR